MRYVHLRVAALPIADAELLGHLAQVTEAARGLRVPARYALLADVVPASACGRSYGFERRMDNLGAIVGPLLALGLVAVFSMRTAILISVIPGLLAALAIVYAIRHARLPTARERRPLRIRVRPVLHGQLGQLLGAFAPFEIGYLAATLLILLATDLLALAPARGHPPDQAFPQVSWSPNSSRRKKRET